MLYYKLGVTLAVVTGIMFATSASAPSVIAATSMTGNQTCNSTMKSGNMKQQRKYVYNFLSVMTC
jgi:hypothetical protein